MKWGTIYTICPNVCNLNLVYTPHQYTTVTMTYLCVACSSPLDDHLAFHVAQLRAKKRWYLKHDRVADADHGGGIKATKRDVCDTPVVGVGSRCLPAGGR